MVISDLRSRRIGILHLTIFGITLLTASLLEFGWCQVLVNLSFNLLTVLLLWLSLYGYSSMRKRRFVDEQVEEEALFGGIVDKMKMPGLANDRNSYKRTVRCFPQRTVLL